MASRGNYATPSWLYSGARKFFHMGGGRIRHVQRVDKPGTVRLQNN
jgi:hypothetical protein